MIFHAKLVKAIDIILNEFHDAKKRNKNENLDNSEVRGAEVDLVPFLRDFFIFRPFVSLDRQGLAHFR